MNFKFKYIAISLALTLFFVVPFVIKTIDMRLEIFPSVILPSSSGTIDIEKEVNVHRMEIYGVANGVGMNKDTIELNKSAFMGDIPKHYLDKLISNKFGLLHFTERKEKTNRLSISYNIKSKVSEQEIEETKTWLRSRLRALDCQDSVLIVKSRRIIVSPKMEILADTMVKTDTIYDLYR